MHGRPLSPVVLALAVATLAGCGEDFAYREGIDDWHAARIERLRAEDGWLTLVGLHPLREGANVVGTSVDADVRLRGEAPARVGVIVTGAGGLSFAPEPGAPVRRAGGGAVTAPIPVRTDLQDDTTVLAVGTLRFHVIDRGGRLFLRVKDIESATRRSFEGVERFPVDADWRVTARLVPHDPPRGVAMPNALGQVTLEPSPGTLVFELAGRTLSLTPTGEPGEDLFIVFADATTGDGTYGGGRFLSAAAPDENGEVVLDFNKATNPPCAFTPHATCPLPPEGNTLELRVEAGEKTWGQH